MKCNMITLRHQAAAQHHADILCIPPAGFGPAVYNAWRQTQGAPDVQILAPRLPGRESRILEEGSSDSALMARAICDEYLVRREGKPGNIVLYGHCFGGLLACSVAELIRNETDVSLAGVVITGIAEPRGPQARAGVLRSELSDDELLDEFELIGKLPPAVRADRRYAKAVADALRADMRAFETWKPPRERQTAPLVIIRGREQLALSDERVSQWKAAVTAKLVLRTATEVPSITPKTSLTPAVASLVVEQASELLQ